MEITIIQRGTNHYNLELGISQERTNEMLGELDHMMNEEFLGGSMTVAELMIKAITLGNNENEQALILLKIGEILGWMRAQKESQESSINEMFNQLFKGD
jgi:hypothetical protein